MAGSCNGLLCWRSAEGVLRGMLPIAVKAPCLLVPRFLPPSELPIHSTDESGTRSAHLTHPTDHVSHEVQTYLSVRITDSASPAAAERNPYDLSLAPAAAGGCKRRLYGRNLHCRRTAYARSVSCGIRLLDHGLEAPEPWGRVISSQS